MLVLAMEFSRDRDVERPDVSGEARPRLVAGPLIAPSKRNRVLPPASDQHSGVVPTDVGTMTP